MPWKMKKLRLCRGDIAAAERCEQRVDGCIEAGKCGSEGLSDVRHNSFYIHESPLSTDAACEFAIFFRPDDDVAALEQSLHILLCGGVIPHLRVHGGEDERWGSVDQVE